MTQEDWKQIDELFQAALNEVPGDRAAFLDRECAGNEAMRRELESLLGHDDQAKGFLEEPPGEVAAELLTSGRSRFLGGQLLNHYRIVEFLGAGGMGEVYLARDTKLDRSVAIKVLKGPFTSDSAKVRRFEQEARAASALNHPNIVTIHEVGRADVVHYIVAEYIEGQTLRQRLAQSGPMKAREALDVALQVASALDSAHAAGIVHRDIKTDNVMLRPDRLIKVLDFGLAKLSEAKTFVSDCGLSDSAASYTIPGVVMGTARYMSPEQARGLKVDARTDIWSLGVVLFEMLAGAPPFDGETPSHVIVDILDGPAPRLAARVDGIPRALERIVDKSLSKNVGERYRTAKEFADDLKNVRAQLDSQGELDQPKTFVVNRRRFRPVNWRRRGAMTVLATLVLTACLQRGAPKANTNSREAHQLYLQGRYYRQKDNGEGIQKMGDSFKKAIDIDSNYALAWAGLADYYGIKAAGGTSGAEYWPKAEEAAVKALALDPSIGEAHYALAAVRMWYDRKWRDTESELKRAIELNPEFADSYWFYARLLEAMGRTDEAIAAAKQSSEVDPHSPHQRRLGFGEIYFYARRYDLAVEEFRKSIENDPGAGLQHLGLAEVYVQQQKFTEALAEARKAKDLIGNPGQKARLGAIFAAAGDTKEATKILVEVQGVSTKRVKYFTAAIYAALGDRNEAIAWLTKAVDEFDTNVIDLKVDPRFDSLRQDPRFTALLGRLHLLQ